MSAQELPGHGASCNEIIWALCTGMQGLQSVPVTDELHVESHNCGPEWTGCDKMSTRQFCLGSPNSEAAVPRREPMHGPRWLTLLSVHSVGGSAYGTVDSS
eukprot:jgi/Mesvir1/14521/Mv26239-RA.1